MIKINNFPKIIILIICCVFLYFVQRNTFLKPNFVDEQDNFVVAKNLINKNKLYSNIFSHHQPGGYLISSLVQTVFKPNSIEMLVKKHRQFIFAWSVAWFAFIVLRFNFKLLIPFLIFELIKDKYLGNLFLAESLVVTPMIYLFLSFIENKLKTKELFFWGLVVGFVGITLAPMWPVLSFMGLFFLFRYRSSIHSFFLIMFGGLFIILITIPFINIKGYFRDAILVNQKYYIPIAGGGNLFVSTIKSFFTPILFLKDGLNIPEALIIKIVVLVFIVLIIYQVKQKQWTNLFLVTTVLGLSNLRNFELEKIFYDGFHLLIWLGLVITITFYFIEGKNFIITTFVAFFVFFLNHQKPFISPNYIQDFEIYYSRIFNMSEAIRSTKNNHDTLLAMPDHVLSYWQADIKPAGRFIFFYRWMATISEIKNEQYHILEEKPEYLIVGSSQGLDLSSFLNNYRNFKYRGSDSSEFYIRNDLYQKFSQEKIEKLEFYGLKVI